MAEVKRKPRLGKNRKKSWRTHSEIKDVEDYLDDKRVEERLGKPFTERENHELFIEDKRPSKTKKFSCLQEYREHLRSKPIKCLQILKNVSAVEDPLKKRNRLRTPEERKTELMKKIQQQRLERGLPKERIHHIKKHREARRRQAENERVKENFELDIWDDTEEKKVLGSTTDWFRSDMVGHLVTLTESIGKKILKKRKIKNEYVPSALPAIELPHPGTSYNPSYIDHQNLLAEAVEAEMKIMKHEKYLRKITTDMFPKITVEELERRWMEEMKEGIPKLGGGEEEETKPTIEEIEEEMKELPPTKMPAKKTRQKRNRLRKAREEELKRLKAKIEKKKLADIYKLRFLKQELDKMEENLEEAKNKREVIKEKKKYEPKRVGVLRFKKPDGVFSMKKELKGNLLEVQAQGNPLLERFKSLQERNMIQTSSMKRQRKQLKFKMKWKTYENKSHKMGWEPKGY